ncbi:MAG TPA: hypothetical protein VFV19_08415 [Candidatus Polarisedimenticolaceae bacterium]|nr:hypothetical protein [Candidatus Polarisedimenticolaceae bacterium]
MNLNARSAFLIGFAGSMSLGLMPVASAAPSATLSDGLRAALTHVSVDTKGLAPQVRITSPLNGAFIAPGDGRVGAGNPNGTGMAIVAEIVTRDTTSISVDEDVNIRHVDKLGSFNPQFPGLFVFLDEDLVTPTGTIIRADTNLAPLFNIAGSDDTPGPGVTVWVGWHVLESLRPASGAHSFNLTVAVIDNAGRVGFDRIKLNVDTSVTDRFGTSGNGLTQNPGEANRVAGGTAPVVQILAPREPSAVTFGLAPPNGSLAFIQVAITDKEGDVVVDEVGNSDGTVDPTGTNLAAALGRIDDPAAGVGNPNRNVPGFDFEFSVPSGAAGGLANVNVGRLFNVAGSEVILLEDGTPAVRTVLNWVVGAPFVGSALLDNFVTFKATVTDANGNQGVATRTFQLTHSAVNGQALTPQPIGF